eukprot:g3169.t1
MDKQEDTFDVVSMDRKYSFAEMSHRDVLGIEKRNKKDRSRPAVAVGRECPLNKAYRPLGTPEPLSVRRRFVVRKTPTTQKNNVHKSKAQEHILGKEEGEKDHTAAALQNSQLAFLGNELREDDPETVAKSLTTMLGKFTPKVWKPVRHERPSIEKATVRSLHRQIKQSYLRAKHAKVTGQPFDETVAPQHGPAS